MDSSRASLVPWSGLSGYERVLAWVRDEDPDAVVLVGADSMTAALGIERPGWTRAWSPLSLMVTYAPTECDDVPERWADMVEHLQCAAIVAGHKES